MILAGGRHILCSPKILGKYMASCTTVEIDAEKERFKAMCFILRADENRYASDTVFGYSSLPLYTPFLNSSNRSP